MPYLIKLLMILVGFFLGLCLMTGTFLACLVWLPYGGLFFWFWFTTLCFALELYSDYQHWKRLKVRYKL